MTETEFTSAIESFPVSALLIAVESSAEGQISSAVEEAGILLVGESHGVLENPLVLYTLMHRFGITSLGLEWPSSMQPMVDGFLKTGDLSYSLIADSADGRITAGHFAVLRALSREGQLARLVLFDPLVYYSSWSERDRGLAAQLLKGLDARAGIAAAGNLHTQLQRHKHGVPMGMHIVRERPRSLEIRLRYGAGEYFNFGPKRFRSRMRWPWSGDRLTLRWNQTRAVLTMPRAHIAAVPAGRP